MKKIDHLGDLGLDGMITLKCIFKTGQNQVVCAFVKMVRDIQIS
jgi:hypothetical protein